MRRCTRGAGRNRARLARSCAGKRWDWWGWGALEGKWRAAEWGVELMPLAEMLGQADYVSLHTALSPATEGLINQATLAQMKRGARLINTARGGLVGEGALGAAAA